MDRLLDRIPARVRSGWTVVGLIALVVLAVWIPDIDLALGDSDDGRILARFGLQARNFYESPSNSGFGASMAPYGGGANYAHHPPLLNFAHIISVGVVGESVIALRLWGFLVGAATVGFMAALLRVRGLAWGSTLLAVGAMASTGFFFVYMRQGGGFSLIVAFAAAVAYLRERSDPPRWMLASAGALAMATAMQSWLAMAAAGLLIVWLFAEHRFAPVTWWVAGGGLLGVVITAGWILNATDLAELGGQVETRTDTANFTFSEFTTRQWRFAQRLTPIWLQILMLPALVVGLIDRRTRVPLVITLGVAAAWTFGLQEGAWVHVLWNLPWLAPITIGLAAVFDKARDRIPTGVGAAVGLLAAVVLLGTLWGVSTGRTHTVFLDRPAQAGELLDANEPADGARWAWVAPGVNTPRWVSYYWDLPVRTLTEALLDDLQPDDLVLVNKARVPEHIPAAAVAAAVDETQRYALVSGAAIADARSQSSP